VLAAFPTALHLGPFTLHLYGIGLAIAVYVTFRYVAHRLSQRGIDSSRWGAIAGATVIAALIGARIAHVATNWHYYSTFPSQIVALWGGGLSSFGGIALATPVAIVLVRRTWPQHSLLTIADIIVPALVAGWALGRLLGPQFMVGGGGHLTTQWFGMTYEGQIGKRVPVPLIQAAEDALLWMGLLWTERRAPRGVVTGLALLIWGVVRTLDERWLLGEAGHIGSVSVQISGLVLAGIGLLICIKAVRGNRAVKN